jgi:hypothetical protein
LRALSFTAVLCWLQVKALAPAANLGDALAAFGCFAAVAGGAVYSLGSAFALLQAGQKRTWEELLAGLQALAALVASLRGNQLDQRLERLESAAITSNLLRGGGSASPARLAKPP